jgi:hypothetical protein
MKRPGVVIVVLVCVLAIVSVVGILRGGARGRSVAAPLTTSAADEPGKLEAEGPRSGSEMDLEQQETAERIDAANEARAAGTFGKPFVSTSSSSAGWTGSQLMNPATDDWEPAVAADPNAPYVYLITTRYGQPKTCPSHCPTPYIALTVSSDGGHTWGPQVPLCVCRGSKAQYDPTIEVVPNTGAVYSAFLNADRAGGFSTVFIRSTDHGATWTDPVHVYGKVSWTDKPEVTTNATGEDVYVSWNGPQGGDLYIGQSHDAGRTWTQQKLTSTKRYYYAYDGRVLPDGTVVFSESSETYSGSTKVAGSVWHHAIISRDRGATWENIVVAKGPVGEPCVAEGCSPDFYTGQTSVVSDAAGHLVFAYESPEVAGGPQRIFVKTSSDEGRTWSAATALSVSGENATGPRLASSGNGDVRMWYMRTERGDDADAWNVWYRSSRDGGKTWSSAVKLNDAGGGSAGYVNPDGSFQEVYGDYGEIAVTSQGKTFAAWGEGFSWLGPGGTWFDLQS